MASTTPNYGFATGVATDDFVEPEHNNRLADTIDRTLGEFLRHIIPAGAHEGWEITGDKEVSAGQGLIGACWCRTAEAQEIVGLSAGAVNHVYGAADAQSAPEGTVQFVAQTAPPGPGEAVYLGTIELDGEGEVVEIDNAAPAAQRNCYRLAIERLEGSGLVGDVPAQESVVVEVDHASEGEFRVPGDLRVTSASPDFEWEVVEAHRGDRFRLQVTNAGGEAADFAYEWSREGLAR